MANQYSGDLTAQIMLAAASPAGLRTDSINGYSTHRVSQRASQMVREGLLFRAKISHKVVRYFTSEAAAKALEKPTYEGVSVRQRLVPKSAWADAVPQNFDHIEVTECPAPVDDRFSPDEGATEWKLFSSLKPGQYIAPASKWVEAVA